MNRYRYGPVLGLVQGIYHAIKHVTWDPVYHTLRRRKAKRLARRVKDTIDKNPELYEKLRDT